MNPNESKKDQIIEAATAEFLEQGLRKASMNNIADRAQVSKRTLYKHFASKEELYEHLITELFNEIEKEFHVIHYDENIPFHEQIESIVLIRLKSLHNEKMLQLSRLILSETLKSNPINSRVHQKFLNLDKSFFSWLQEAKKHDVLVDELSLDEIHQQFHAILTGLVFYPLLLRKISLPTDKERKEIAQKITRLFLKCFAK